MREMCLIGNIIVGVSFWWLVTKWLLWCGVLKLALNMDSYLTTTPSTSGILKINLRASLSYIRLA